MNSQLKKLGTLVTATCGLILTQADFAQATDYAYFTFGFGSNYGEFDYYNGGWLAFSLSPLKGIGREQISYSALENYFLNNVDLDNYDGTDPLYPMFGYSYITANPLDTIADGSDDEFVTFEFNNTVSDPVFTFQSGELVGINHDNGNTVNISGSEGRGGPPFASASGVFEFFLRGDEYLPLISYETVVSDYVYTPIYDEFSEVIDYIETLEIVEKYSIKNQRFNSGTIQFTTITPVEPIPEPLTLLGAGTAIGMGTIFKRKLNKKK